MVYFTGKTWRKLKLVESVLENLNLNLLLVGKHGHDSRTVSFDLKSDGSYVFEKWNLNRSL